MSPRHEQFPSSPDGSQLGGLPAWTRVTFLGLTQGQLGFLEEYFLICALLVTGWGGRAASPRHTESCLTPEQGTLLSGCLWGTAGSASAAFSARLARRDCPHSIHIGRSREHPLARRLGWQGSRPAEGGPCLLGPLGGAVSKSGCREAWRGLIPCPITATAMAWQGPGPLDPDPLAQALTCFTAVGLLGGYWAVSDPGYRPHT